METYAEHLGSESATYWAFHRERLRWTAELTKEIMSGRAPDFRLLDVGNSFQTLLLARIFPEAVIDTLGYHDDRYALRAPSAHHQYDLNLSHDHESWPELRDSFDIIILLEVIEHLHVSPQHVLAQFYAYLKPGGLLMISTPNAASLQRRRAMLFGRNPFEPIRPNHHRDPGHVREYTHAELKNYARSVGFVTERVYLHEPYKVQPHYNWFFYRCAKRMFPSLRNSITAVFHRPKSH